MTTPLALANDKQSSEVKSLGELKPFWRNAVSIVPWSINSHPVEAVPKLWLKGDFPYQKKKNKEALFADHLSIVRPLGGQQNKPYVKTFGFSSVEDMDLIYRDESGKIVFKPEQFKRYISPIVDAGYTSLTFVLDNVPYALAKAEGGRQPYGNSAAPNNMDEWQTLVEWVAAELKNTLGPKNLDKVRFRVGTEMNKTNRFSGTEQEYFEFYYRALLGVRKSFPTARVGFANISGATGLYLDGEMHNVNVIRLANYLAKKQKTAADAHLDFGWGAVSAYYHVNDSVLDRTAKLGNFWNRMESMLPQQYQPMLREIHEFGIAPFAGEAKEGYFVTEEPGARGAAHLAAAYWKLQEIGTDKVFRWKDITTTPKEGGGKATFPTANAWTSLYLEHFVGKSSWILPTSLESGNKDWELITGASEGKNGKQIMIVAAQPDGVEDEEITLSIKLPDSFKGNTQDLQYTALNRKTSPLDYLRNQLADNDALNEKFVNAPDRLGLFKKMAVMPKGKHVAMKSSDKMEEMFLDTMTLKPFTPDMGKLEGNQLTIKVNAPGIVVIRLPE